MSERLGTDSAQSFNLLNLLPFEDYVTCDSHVETCAALSTEDIVASVLPQEEEEDEEVTLVENAPRISAKEALMEALGKSEVLRCPAERCAGEG